MELERIDTGTKTVVLTESRTGHCLVRVGPDGRVTDNHPFLGAVTSPHRTTLGLVDLQVNGFAGVDFNQDTLTGADLDRALTAMLKCGTTRCLPTVITASAENMAARIEALDRAVGDSRLGPWMVAGYHVEGPFLSPQDGYAGCHPKQHMRAADEALFDRIVANLERPVRIVTVAPECDGVLDFISQAVAHGVVVAIGHTNATHDQIMAAAAAGARLSTHLGNALSDQLSKNENPLFAQLAEDRLNASFIADGIHIPPYMLQTYLRAKGYERSIVVTDATAGAAAAPGRYALGDLRIERGADGIVREPGSPYLAGSATTMADMARNLIEWFDMTLQEVVVLARSNPLALLGDSNLPAPGDAAELVTWRNGPDGLRVHEARVGPWRIAGHA